MVITSTIGNRVVVISGTRVRIPPSPPEIGKYRQVLADFIFSLHLECGGNGMDNALTFRNAERKDTARILQFIKELAEYEHMADEVVADEATLETWIFDKQKAEVIFAVKDGEEIGFALFFHNFSTFLGRAGIYLEDLYVKPAYRGKGYGKAILKRLAAIAVERGCGRLEWWCLDWNKPSIDFYLSLGAEPMADRTVYRMAGETLKHLADG